MTDAPQSRTPPYTANETQAWLAWLARHMRREHQTIFLIEQLQPSWLATRGQRVLRVLFDSVALGALTGFILYLGWWLSEQLDPPTSAQPWIPLWLWMSITAAWAFAMGIVDDAELPWLGSRAGRSRLANTATIALRLVLMFGSWALLWTLVQVATGQGYADIGGCGHRGLACGSMADRSLRLGRPMVSAAYIAVIYASKIRGETIVKPVEALGWSWLAAFQGLITGVLAGVVVWAVYAGYHTAAGDLRFQALTPNLFLYPPLGGAGGFVIGGLGVHVVQEKFQPNQGMRLSLRNALLAAAIIGPIIAIVAWPSLYSALVSVQGPQISARLPRGILTLGAMGSLVGFAWFGGRELIMHGSLRLVLTVTGQTPANLARFLDYCATELDFLRKVGGGWVFIHRYLLEYFSTVAVQPSQSPGLPGSPGSPGSDP